VLGFALVLLGGVSRAAPPKAPPPPFPTDAARVPPEEGLKDAVERALRAMLGAAADVQVTVHGGTVTLSGTVIDQPMVWMARETATAVEGVERVADAMAIEPEAGSDRELAQRVSTILGADPATSGQRIDVQSARHVVTLTGDVTNDAVSRRARELAAATRGVLEVTGHLRPHLAYAIRRPPGQIRDDVTDRTSGLLRAGRVDVAVDGDRVILSGQVPRGEDRRTILAEAWAPGVTAVDANRLVVRWWSGESAPAPRTPPRPSDPELQGELSRVLERDPRFAGFTLQARVEDGAAALAGPVPTPALARAAEALASLLPGITGLRSGLRVESALVWSDAAIARQVRARLTSDPFAHGRTIQVNVQAGRVLLDGWVDSADEDVRAQFLSVGVPGVLEVESRLEVRSHAAPRARKPVS
jgi:osmotically-inducible protein OsmY